MAIEQFHSNEPDLQVLVEELKQTIKKGDEHFKAVNQFAKAMLDPKASPQEKWNSIRDVVATSDKSEDLSKFPEEPPEGFK